MNMLLIKKREKILLIILFVLGVMFYFSNMFGIEPVKLSNEKLNFYYLKAKECNVTAVNKLILYYISNKQIKMAKYWVDKRDYCEKKNK